MRARKGWTAAGRWAAVAAAALALTGTASAPATAAQAHEHEHEPTYRCVLLETHHDLPFAVGRFCAAFHGAPHEGPVFGTFLIESPRGAVRCEVYHPFSGFAELPERVEGRFCHRVE